MKSGEKIVTPTGELPPPPRMIVSLRALLPVLEHMSSKGLDGATVQDLGRHLAITLTHCAMELHELHARIGLMSSALLAGDTLVSLKGHLLLPETAKVFEGWHMEAARAQQELHEVADKLSERILRSTW